MKTQEFLAKVEIEAKTEVNAKKETYKADEAWGLAEKATHLFAARGKKVVKLDLKKDQPAREDVLKLMLGPTGNLRAPTLRVGKKLLVGFNEDMYEEVFG